MERATIKPFAVNSFTNRAITQQRLLPMATSARGKMERGVIFLDYHAISDGYLLGVDRTKL